MKMKRSSTPGVGKYDITRKEREGPKYTINNHNKETVYGELQKAKQRAPTPGPGKYNENYSAVKKRTVLGVFNKSEKLKPEKIRAPGVGHYKPKTGKEFGTCEKINFLYQKLSDRI